MLHSILEIPTRDFDRVASGLFAYLFGRISRSGFYEYTEDRTLAKRVLTKARTSGYVLKECKLYAHTHYKSRLKGTTTPKPKDFNVTNKDSLFLRRLNLKTDKYPCLTLSQFDDLIGQSLMTPDMQTYIGKLVSKKMTFLVRHYGVPRAELESSLISAALYALYKQYPRYESMLHAKNICKTTIHNTAMNLIQHHTRGKRQALQATVGGFFESVHVPLDCAFDLHAPITHEHKDAIQSLVELQPKMSFAVQQFLSAAAGIYNDGLSLYIGEANDQAVETMSYDRYLGKLKEYFNVNDSQVQSLFSSLRTHLS